MKRLGIIILSAFIFISCNNQFAKVLKSKDNEYKYKMAEQYYAKGKYNQAQQLFDELFPYLKGTARFEDMYYKYAYALFYQEDYQNAENFFKTYTENFPNSPKAEECDYMRAFCYYKQSPKVDLDQTDTQKTIGLMQAFINTHPGSARIKDATEIIDASRAKLEQKEYKAAELYYNLGYYKAAAIAFATLIESFPDSEKSENYKLKVIQSYYKYAEMSVTGKQQERFEKVISEVTDFAERFPDSKLLNEVNNFKSQSNNFIKNIKNEQVKKTT